MAIRKPRARPQLNADKLQGRSGWAKVPRKDLPKFNGDEIRAALRSYDRVPFLDMLSEWIAACPDPSIVAAFAEKHPDKYITALSGLARVAGFTEKTETMVDVTINYRALSDSQLEDRIAALQSELGVKVIEHSPNGEAEPQTIAALSADREHLPASGHGNETHSHDSVTAGHESVIADHDDLKS